MSKALKIILIFLVFDIIVVAGYFGYKAISSQESKTDESAYEWLIIDENYVPQNFIEEYIKKDSEEKGLFPVSIKNYRKNPDILRKFKGKNFAGPSESHLNMMYKGLDDWMLLDLKYKTEKEREVLRTILYVYIDGTWRVGDSGQLTK